MIQSPETQARIAEWRRKALDGSITLEEMKQAIIVLRESRTSAAQQAKTRSTRASNKPPAKSADQLLDEFENG